MPCEAAKIPRRDLQEALASQRSGALPHQYARIISLSVRLLAQRAICALQRRRTP